MNLVVNTNRIIAALIKDSFTRKIIFHGNFELFTIPMSEEEVQRYRTEILQKARITPSQFGVIIEKLNEKLILLPDELVETKMKEAKKIMDKIDKDDTIFIAAALATKSGIWSEDKHFQRQNKVKIWKTRDLMSLVDYED